MKQFILVIFIITANCCFAQNVYLEGKQFKLGTNNFYPMVLNYNVEAAYNTFDYYSVPAHMYGVNNEYECFDLNDCSSALQNDFNTIAGMDFNCIRIAGFYPQWTGQGLVFPFASYDSQGNHQGSYEMPITTQNMNNHILPMYEKILELADNAENSLTSQPAPLKVIFLLTGRKSNFDIAEQTAYNDFANDLSLFISASNYSDALFAYDLMNEPAFHDISNKSKQEACELINSWYNTIHNNDPTHLITVGMHGSPDVLKYDPSIIKTDFLSLHTYPFWAEHEDKSNSSEFLRAFERVAIDMFWLDRNSSVPWIIGETAISADDINAPLQSIIADATETQQVDFANFSLDATCNCGGSGYSWWVYQDYCHLSDNNSGSWMGLLRMCPVNGHTSGEKPVINSVFRNYSPPTQISACNNSCPLDYVDAYDESKLFYNPFLHPPNPSTISGVITDQDGNGISDAFVGGRTFNGISMVDQSRGQWYHGTFSDKNGNYAIIPFKNSDPAVFLGGNYLLEMDVSAAGAERRAFGNEFHIVYEPMPVSNNLNITLNKVDFKYNGSINNITIHNSEIRNFEGYNTLTIKDVIVNSGGNSDMTARTEVQVNSAFHAEYGSNIHIFCSETEPDCNDYANFTLGYRMINQLPIENVNSEKIEISFIKQPIKKYSVSPNPSHDVFHIQIFNNSNDLISFEIYNSIGDLIQSFETNSNYYFLNMTEYVSGIYILKINDANDIFIEKLIKQ